MSSDARIRRRRGARTTAHLENAVVVINYRVVGNPDIERPAFRSGIDECRDDCLCESTAEIMVQLWSNNSFSAF